MLKTFISFLVLILIIKVNVLAQSFSDVTPTNIAPTGGGTLVWADFDNDDDLDFIISGYGNQYPISTKIYTNQGNGQFTESLIDIQRVVLSSIDWGDYDGDNNIDILISGSLATGTSGPNSSYSAIYKNNGNNTFTELASPKLPIAEGSSVAWSDVDSDGDLDFILSGNSNGTPISSLFINKGNSSFIPTPSQFFPTLSSDAGFVDVDKDGDQDLLLAGFFSNDENLSKVYLNEGDGTYIENTAVNLPGIEDGFARWCDFNNDGFFDIALSGYNRQQNIITKIFINDGHGQFNELMNNVIPPLDYSSIAEGDIDNDGDSDILITGKTTQRGSALTEPVTKIYKNNALSFKEASELTMPGIFFGDATLADYDNDGDLDVSYTGEYQFNSYLFKLYQNQSIIANTKPNPPSLLKSAINKKTITLDWDKGLDKETTQEGLSYNLYVKDTSSSHFIVSPMANPMNGYRKIQKYGNTNFNQTVILSDLPYGVYEWAVQSIDASFSGSKFSDKQYFIFGIIGKRKPCADLVYEYQVATMQQYNWTVEGGTIIDGLNSQKIKVRWNQQNAGKVIFSSANVDFSLAVEILSNPKPLIKRKINYLYYDGASLVKDYQWYLEDEALEEFKDSILVKKAGNYYLKTSYQNSCSNKSDPFLAALITGIEKPVTPEKVLFYPNPVDDHIQIQGNVSAAIIYQADGRLLKELVLDRQQINLGWLKPGIYILKMTNKDRSTYSKIIKL
jgi:hypothetical protein